MATRLSEIPDLSVLLLEAGAGLADESPQRLGNGMPPSNLHVAVGAQKHHPGHGLQRAGRCGGTSRLRGTGRTCRVRRIRSGDCHQ